MDPVCAPSVVIPVPTLCEAEDRRALIESAASLAVLATGVHLVLDLSAVTAINADGVAALLACRKHVTERNGSMDVAGVSPELRVLLELTGLQHIVPGVSGQVSATVAA